MTRGACAGSRAFRGSQAKRRSYMNYIVATSTGRFEAGGVPSPVPFAPHPRVPGRRMPTHLRARSWSVPNLQDRPVGDARPLVRLAGSDARSGRRRTASPETTVTAQASVARPTVSQLLLAQLTPDVCLPTRRPPSLVVAIGDLASLHSGSPATEAKTRLGPASIRPDPHRPGPPAPDSMTQAPNIRG